MTGLEKTRRFCRNCKNLDRSTAKKFAEGGPVEKNERLGHCRLKRNGKTQAYRWNNQECDVRVGDGYGYEERGI